MKLSFEKKGNYHPKTVKVGVYESVVTSIKYCSDFDIEEAFEVKYDLVDEKGVHYSHKEVFYNNVKNERTRAFFKYLTDNGICLDNVDTFVGCRERLVFKKQIGSNQKAYINIVSRQFLSHPEVKQDAMAQDR